MASQSPSSLWVTGEENGFPRPFGNYLLLAAFAQGGMGELFLAMNGSIAGAFRLCVVKKLRADLTNDKEYVNRFVDEAKVVVQLNHANISHVFDIGRIEGQYYLAMEYVSGISVKKLMSRAEELNTKIPQEIAILIAREVLEALDYAHSHSHPITGDDLQVVHRDVSPQNVLVSWAGEVKLIDFGLALSALKDEHTATGAVMGKVAYMPPEQARGDEVGAACDQFSTAVVAYEMVAGDRYHGDLPLHAIWAIAGMGNFPPPKWNLLPKELQIILQRALHNDPFRRYPTCGDLREALGAYMSAHHPATSGRTLRDLLGEWFKEYRAEERELLAQFRDVTGSKVREAVKATVTTAESLVSGPHRKREPAWQMPPTAPDAKSISESGPKAPSGKVRAPASSGPTPSAPTAPSPSEPPSSLPNLSLHAPPDARFDGTSSMKFMPPPAAGGAPSVAFVEAAAASLLGPATATPPSILAPPAPAALPTVAVAAPMQTLAPPGAAGSAASAPTTALPPPLLVPLGPMNTVGESTERFLMRGGGAAVSTLTPRALSAGASSVGASSVGASSIGASTGGPVVTVGESTERLMREQTAGLAVLTPANAPAVAQPLVPITSAQSIAPSLTPSPSPPSIIVAVPPVSVPTASVPTATVPTATVPTATVPTAAAVPAAMIPSTTGPRGTSAISRHESTERVRKRDDENEDDVDELAFGKRGRAWWPLAAAAAGIAAIVVAVIVVTSSEKPTTPPNDVVTTNTPINTPRNNVDVAPNNTVPDDTAANNVDVARNDVAPNDTAPNSVGTNPDKPIDKSNTTVRNTTKKDPKDAKGPKDPKDKKNPTTTSGTPETAANDASRDAARARERVDALKRSACSDPCVGTIVGQLETMPGAAELTGFRKSVAACVEVCRK